MARRLALVLALLAASGCSVFTSYVEQTAEARRAFQSLEAERASQLLEKGTESSLDRLCYLLERGLILHAAGKLVDGNHELFQAVDDIDAMEDKAVISLSDTAAGAGTLLLNEKTVPYAGEPFEHVLLHAYLAMNFLFSGDVGGARVEIRRMQEIQKDIREKAKEEAEGAAESRKHEPSASGVQSALERAYSDQDEVAARVQNLYDDALAYALSALVYEMNGEPNDAYIDLKRALELRPELVSLRADAYRAAMLSGLREEAKELAGKGKAGAPPEPAKEQAELVVLYECGDAPLKGEIKLPIPTGHGLTAISLPKYQLIPNPYRRAVVRDAGGSVLGATELYTDVEAIAVRTLHDRMAVLALKQAIRSVGKAVLAKQAGDKAGGWGLLLVSLYTVLSEQADLRSWTTLPASLQWVRIPLPPGEHRLTIALEGRDGGAATTRDVVVNLARGQKRFVNVRSTGPAIYLNLYPTETPKEEPS